MFSIFSRQLHGPEVRRRKEGRKKNYFHWRTEKYGKELIYEDVENSGEPIFLKKEKNSFLVLVLKKAGKR